MQVTGVEAVGDPSSSVVQGERLLLERPLSRQSPIVRAQPGWESVRARLINNRTTGRDEVLRAVVSDVVFRGPQVAPIGSRLEAAAIHCDGLTADIGRAGLSQQLLKDHL